jgi:hypothetical protein
MIVLSMWNIVIVAEGALGCLFVWDPVSGCTAACRLIVHTSCVFNAPTFTASRIHVTTTLEILAAKCGT